MDFTKYEHEIREPQEITVEAEPKPWHGAEVRIYTKYNEHQAGSQVLTVEEAYALRDALSQHLFDTYGFVDICEDCGKQL